MPDSVSWRVAVLVEVLPFSASVEVAATESVNACVVPEGTVTVRPGNCDAPRVQVPSAFFVPFDRTADEGNPEIRTDSVSEPSVSVNAELMFSAIGAPALPLALDTVNAG